MMYSLITKMMLIPGLSRRLVDKVRESPRIARKMITKVTIIMMRMIMRMITKMTSPGQRRQRRLIHDEEIFIVSVNVLHSSGHSGHGDTLRKRDAW